MAKAGAKNGDSAKPVGASGAWQPSTGSKTKLKKSVAKQIDFAGVRSRYCAAHAGDETLPKSLIESRIKAIGAPSREGLSESSFIQTLAALGKLFPELFAGKTYGDVAENPKALASNANKKIVTEVSSVLPAGDKPLSEVGPRSEDQPTPLKPGKREWLRAILTLSGLLALVISLLWNGIISSRNSTLALRNHQLTEDVADYRNRINTYDPLAELPQALGDLDSKVFYGRKDKLYEIVRLIPNNGSLRSNTDFVSELNETVYTFDMIANTAGVVREQWLPIIEDGLRRGVDYRIILSDYRRSNAAFDAFSEAVKEESAMLSRGAAIEHHGQLFALIERLEADKKSGADVFRGSLQVRWNPYPLLHTMWIRDLGQPTALAHLGVHFYQGKNTWPSIRLTPRISPDGFDNVAEEFRVSWERSLKFDKLPFPPEPSSI